MAIYHLNQGVISRSTGRSAVQSAAYITGRQISEERRGITANYQNRAADVMYTDTLTPDQAPGWARDVYRVWNRLEEFEDLYAEQHYKTLTTQERYKRCAQVAQTMVVALPREFSPEICHEVIREFAQERFVSRGLIVTYAIHDDEGNPHAHLLISRRRIEENGELSGKKDREICKKSELKVTRKLWADLVNQYLEREGFEARISEKSFLESGIHLLPSQHRGWMADKLVGRGIQSRVVFDNHKIILENRKMLLEKPETILTELTAKQATFTQLDLLKSIQKRVGDDDALVAQVFEGALQAARVVGEDRGGRIRYTSESYQRCEEAALKQTEQLAHQTYRQEKVTEEAIQRFIESSSVVLSEEQRQAVRALVGNQPLAVLVGRAGAGKTTSLKVVAEIYQQAGHKVIGTSLAALAADNLEAEAQIPSHTLQSWLYRWKRYEEAQQKFLSFTSIVTEGVLKQLDWYQDLKRFESAALTSRHVVILDEAGMVGTRSWHELQYYVQKSGAKLVAVGDDHQFKPIDAGDYFREVLNRAEQDGSVGYLQEIRRQKVDWMKEASQHFANLEIQEALKVYEHKGHIHALKHEEMSAQIAKTYVQKIQTPVPRDSQASCGNKQPPYPQGLVLAYTNQACQKLNEAIRQQLREKNFIAEEDAFTLKNKGYALGDTIVFLKNDKKEVPIVDEQGAAQEGLFVKNGNRGVIRDVKALNNFKDPKTQARQPVWQVTVELTGSGAPKFAVFNTKAYDHFDHGYAVTLHKAQGQTVDFTLVAACRLMDAKALYVALTRHRYDAQLYYSTKEFSTFQELATYLSRYHPQDLVKDYTIRPEKEEAYQRVQDYKLAVLDAAAIIRQGHAEGQVDWEAYQEIKAEQKQRGREILADFTNHKVYVHQSGLTEEALQISTGLKARPLSRAEEIALKRVELYGEVALETRKVWKRIQMTSSGQGYRNHELYPQFRELREERDALAVEILAQEPLHREFMKGLKEKFHYGRAVLQKQATAYGERQKKGRVQTPERPYQTVPTKEREGFGAQEESFKSPKEIPSKNHPLPSYGKDPRDRTVTDSLERNPPKESFSSPQDCKAYAASMKEELNSRIKDLAFELLGKPTQRSGCVWRYGRKGSVSIHVAGTKQGLYSNFETDSYGNALRLIQDHFKCDFKEAFQRGAEWLGNSQRLVNNVPKVKSPVVKPVKEDVWTPLFPAPNSFPDLRKERQLTKMLYGRQETSRFAYKDETGDILGYVIRLEDRQGIKITPTLTYCRNEKGEQQWRWKGFGEGRPLYGLEQLSQKPDARVLVVEGEKTAEAAKALFPDYVVVTWSGGCGAVNKSDWSVLKGREVVIWPDNDEAGKKAAVKIEDILKTHNPTEKVHIVNLPSTLPHKWDLADPLPEGFNFTGLKKILQPLPEIQEKHSVQSSDPTESLAKTIQAVAKKYHLEEHIEPQDKAQQLHIQFAFQDFEKVDKHYRFETPPEELMEKAILTGILQHFITTTQRTNHDLSVTRLQDSYDQATATASILVYQLKTNRKSVRFNDAYTAAQEHLDQTEKELQRRLKTLDPQDQAKEKIRLQEKSRLQNQFRKHLTKEQNKKLAAEVHHHGQNPHAQGFFSLRQALFGDSHNLLSFQQTIHQHPIQYPRRQQNHLCPMVR